MQISGVPVVVPSKEIDLSQERLSGHLRWVADRLGSARGWAQAQLPSLAVASASGRCLSVNYELTGAGIREAIELATPQQGRGRRQLFCFSRLPREKLQSAYFQAPSTPSWVWRSAKSSNYFADNHVDDFSAED